MPAIQRALALLLLLASAGSPAGAQTRAGASVSAGTHALTVPWYPAPVADRVNPAVMAGMDRTIRSSEHWRFFWGVNVGLFRHHWWMTGVSVEPELGIGRTLPGGLQTDLRLGLGYLHYFWRRRTMEMRDGKYVQGSSWGKPSLVLPLTWTLAYRGSHDDIHEVQPFVSVRWAAQGLFLPEVPAMTHLFLLGECASGPTTMSPKGGGDPCAPRLTPLSLPPPLPRCCLPPSPPPALWTFLPPSCRRRRCGTRL